eukprot:TRINITY_DN50440_c0_g1_i1.p1 TRINITY_DN50440_c0_g1~~TRINITY_DN50440_c0_g1_i1.p1  ORF type:complete len:1332 (+),score=571.92 TRINITY_DN50440_c0_g1_i1:97-3996(+)
MSKRWDYPSFREDMKDPDPDKPHQALFDLNQELANPAFQLDEQTQASVVDDVLRLALTSSHSDVQGAAVKCIPPLARKIKPKFVTNMVQRLRDPLLGEKKEHRDIATISLKYLVEHLTADYKEGIKEIAVTCAGGLRKAPKDEVKLDVMDVTTDLLRKFGALLIEEHDAFQGCLLKELGSQRLQVRKKAIAGIAALSMHSSEPLFSNVVTAIITGIEKEKGDGLRKYIQLCSAVSRSAGHRLGKSLDRIMPLLLINIQEDRLERIEEDSEKNEVRENVLQAFESFILRCPQQITPFLERVVVECRKAMSHDPYYDYDDDDAGEDEVMEGDEDEYGEQLDADADDDDDVSWKVRKAGAKCLSAMIEMRPDHLHVIYEQLCSPEARRRDVQAATPSLRTALPERFKEREESVRLDIFKVFTDLLRATQVTVHGTDMAFPSAGGSIGTGSAHAALRHKVEARPEAAILLEVRDFVCDCICKALRDKNMKIKTTCFVMLKEFAAVLRGTIEPQVGRLLKCAREALHSRDATSALKTEALQFLHIVVVSCPPDSPGLQAAVPELLPVVMSCVQDRYYKITSEALRVCGELTPVVVQHPKVDDFTRQLYDAVYGRLSTADVDQEVKDAAIATMGSLLRYAASAKLATPHLSKALVAQSQEQFLNLLGGDYSRVPVIRTLALCKDVDMALPLLGKFVHEITGFLRKASRPLRQASLCTLKVLIEGKSGDIEVSLYLDLLQEVTPLLVDQDLHLSHLAIDLCAAVLCAAPPAAVSEVESRVLPRFIELMRSPLLQGSALESLENVFETLGPRSKMGYQALLKQVLAASAGVGENRQVLHSCAAVAAKLTRAAPPAQQEKTTEEHIARVSGGGNDHEVALGLACLGEIGRFIDLSAHPTVLPAIQQRFEHPREDVKTLAAAAYGKVTVGACQRLLPILIKNIETSERERYLFFRALKETLSRADTTNPYDPLRAECDRVLESCLNWAAASDEGIRNVVAECLGKLALLQPQQVCRRLLEQAQKAGPVSDKTTTIITSLKYSVSEPLFRYDGLQEDLHVFLNFMNKPQEKLEPQKNAENVKTRRAAVQLFTAAVHSKPDLVRRQLRQHMDALFSQTRVDDELVRSVNLGPFVHKVDDGLELRKSAFECMDILLDGTFAGDSLLDFLNDYDSFAKQLVVGMDAKQGQDIQMLCYFMLGKLCRVQRAHVACLGILDQACADNLLPKAVKTFTEQVKKANVVQQEKDKMQDVMVTMFKMIECIRRVPGAEDNMSFRKFIQFCRTLDSEQLKVAMQKAAEREEAAAHGGGFTR